MAKKEKKQSGAETSEDVPHLTDEDSSGSAGPTENTTSAGPTPPSTSSEDVPDLSSDDDKP